MFSFCIISTFTSLLEIAQVIRDTRQRRVTSLFGQITNCLTLWLEDFPFLTLNLLIVLCRDGEVTYISLAKAFIGIIAAFIRLLFIILNKWLIRHDYERKDCLSNFFNTISTIGVILVLLLSVCIHTIATLPIDHSGRVYFENPSYFTKFKFAHKKYFDNVGIFLNTTNDVNRSIYLTDINDIIEKGQKTFTFSIDLQENVFCIKKYNQTCFKESNDTTFDLYDKLPTNKLINYSITFRYQEPDFYHLLGDIKYNIMRCDLKDYHIDDEKFSFFYYRFKRDLNETKSFMIFNQLNNNYRYYEKENDLEPIERAWRTGLFRCKTTGSLRPHRYQDVKMNDCH